MVDAIISSQITALRNKPLTLTNGPKKAAASLGADIVQSASLPKLILLAGDLANQDPPVNFARISEIRQAIALGTYRVDPEQISAAMLRFGGKFSQ